MIDDSTSVESPRHSGDDSSPTEDPRVIATAESYLQDLKAGRAADRQHYINRYPELANEISECLEGIDLICAGISSQSNPEINEDLLRHSTTGSIPGSPLGDFQIVRQIARGGMGVVYEAIQLSLGRRVALKVLPFAATIDPRHLQRFRIETQAAALLHHTNIVPIYAVGCERGVHFYAMQLINGQSLATVICQLRCKEQPLPPGTGVSTSLQSEKSQDARVESSNLNASSSTVDVSATITRGTTWKKETAVRRVAELMLQAAHALEHAHQAGVIHRDIKPANLLVESNGHLWITDFGLAQLQADSGVTRSSDFVGTFRYMSPEQMNGDRMLLDHRTDIYSLGATFYEFLALVPAFTGQTHPELLFQILHTEPRALRDLNRAVPNELATIITKAISKSPADRYETAGELAADIQRFLSHEHIHARPPSIIDRLRKWSRRHPSAAIAFVILLVVTTAGSLIANRLLSLEQRRTQDALRREELRASEAESRFQQARAAIDALFQVSEEELDNPPSETARKRILDIVLSHYQAFIDQRRGDPTSQAELSAVQDKVKRILYELNVVQREMHTRLLSNEAVRLELNLTNQQSTELQSLITKWNTDKQSLIGEMPNLNEQTRRSRMVVLAEEHERELSNLLTSAQQERFKQISLQSKGVFAFKEPEIVEALRLTSDQRAKIRDVERELFFGSIGRSGPGHGQPPVPPRGLASPGSLGKTGAVMGGDSERFRDDRVRERENALTKVLGILTVDQQEKWRLLTGAPFSHLDDGRFPFPPPF